MSTFNVIDMMETGKPTALRQVILARKAITTLKQINEDGWIVLTVDGQTFGILVSNGNLSYIPDLVLSPTEADSFSKRAIALLFSIENGLFGALSVWVSPDSVFPAREVEEYEDETVYHI